MVRTASPRRCLRWPTSWPICGSGSRVCPTLKRAAHEPKAPVAQEIQWLARMFKVSTLVALRRLFDAGFIGKAALWQHYREELERLRSLERKGSGGGDFYNSLGARTSKRFARAIVSSTLEGLTPFTDAFRMLGVRKTETFYEA